MKKKTVILLSVMLLLTGSLNVLAIKHQDLASYASALKGLKKGDLKTAVYNLVNSHTVISYGSGTSNTWYYFWYTDRNTTTNECLNRYSPAKYYFSSHDGSAISGMNIEHSFPKSWWGGTTNAAYQDLYNLYPSSSTDNSAKSNYPMGKVTNITSNSGDGYDKVGTGYCDGIGTISLWEPGDQYKGDFARGYMYMVTTYQNLTWQGTQGLQILQNDTWPTLRQWAYTLFLQWCKQDSISNLECDRNNTVAKYQGNRNLFVDYPHLADYIWGDSIDVAFDPSTSISTAEDDTRYLKTSTTPSGGGDETTYQFTKVSNITAGKSYLIVANNNGTLEAATPLSSTKSHGYLSVSNVTDNNGIISLTSKDNAFTFENADGGFLLKDSQGRYYYQTGTYTSYNVSTNASDASVWAATAQDDGTFKLMTPAGYYVQYSTKYNSYGCYTTASGLMPLLYELTGETTGIQRPHISNTDTKPAIYNLQGKKVAEKATALPSGVYIKNGKKFVVR